MSNKAFYDKSVPTKNLITTISGIALMVVSLVVSLLLALGKIQPEQTQPLSDALNGIITVGGQLITYISAIILMFKAKD